jgi:hypothetical protein
MFCGGTMIGASGAINGVVGMFLVFFPENEVSCLLLFGHCGRTFSVSSRWVILFWFVFDVLGAIFLTGMVGGVAYFAHVGGFVGGAGLAVLMLKMNWIGMEEYEKSLLELWGRKKSENQEHLRTDIPVWQRQFLNTQPPATKSETAPTQPQTPAVDPEIFFTPPAKTTEEFMRIRCSCGKKLKVPAASAGKTAQCPQCQKRFKIPQKRPVGPQTMPAEPQKPKEPFIRFACSCGKRLKVPADLAGKSGRCPQCQGRLRIPERPGA